MDGSVFSDTLTVTDAADNPVEGSQMVVLPKGSFRMGSSSGPADEWPVRTVTLNNRIAMGRYEVTFADYDRFVAAQSGTRNPGDEGWGRGTRPVINVNQTEAKAYAAWLSTQTGKTYRLPSEAEWEYAARAGAENDHSNLIDLAPKARRGPRRQVRMSNRVLCKAANLAEGMRA